MNTSKKMVVFVTFTIAVVATLVLNKGRTNQTNQAAQAKLTQSQDKPVFPTSMPTAERQSAKAYKLREVRTFANYIKYSDVDKLDLAAELIIVSTPLKNFSDRKHISTRFPDGTLQDFFTLTELTVEKVIKKPSDLALEAPQTFEVIEPVGLIEEKNGKVKILDEDYQDLKQGKRYILFLKKNSAGLYSIINMNLGKFNLDNLDLDDLGDKKRLGEIEEKTKFKKEVLTKFEKHLK